MARAERLSHNHDSSVVSILHFSVLFACHEAQVKRVRHDLFPIFRVSSVNNLEVLVEEFVFEVSAGTEVEQVQFLLLRAVQVVGRVWVCLHDFPLKELTEG